MPTTAFHLWWFVAFILLSIFAAVAGWLIGRGPMGIFIDARGRYSLTHFQAVMWTLVILSSLGGALLASGFNPASLQIPPEVLGLIGVSAGSGVLATAVKSAKDAPGSTARVARVGATFTKRGGSTFQPQAHFAQIWLEEEGDLADQVIDITKFQNFLFTLVVLIFYVTIAWKSGGIPTLPENVVWLAGISHAGYVGAKVPNKQ